MNGFPNSDMVWVVVTDKDVMLFSDERLATSVKGSIADRDPKMFTTTVDAWAITEKILVPEDIHVSDFRGHSLTYTGYTRVDDDVHYGAKMFNQAREQLREDIINLFPDIPPALLQDGVHVPDVSDSDSKPQRPPWQQDQPPWSTKYRTAAERRAEVEQQHRAAEGSDTNTPASGCVWHLCPDAQNNEAHDWHHWNGGYHCPGFLSMLDMANEQLAATNDMLDRKRKEISDHIMNTEFGTPTDDINDVMHRYELTDIYVDRIDRAAQYREVWLCEQPDQYIVAEELWFGPYAHLAEMDYHTLRVVIRVIPVEDGTLMMMDRPRTKHGKELIDRVTCPESLHPGLHPAHAWLNMPAERHRALCWCEGVRPPANQNTQLTYSFQQDNGPTRIMSVDPVAAPHHYTDGPTEEELELAEAIETLRAIHHDADTMKGDPNAPAPRKPVMTRVVEDLAHGTHVEMWWCERPASDIYNVTGQRWTTAEQVIDGKKQWVKIRHIDVADPVYLPADQVAKLRGEDEPSAELMTRDLAEATKMIRGLAFNRKLTGMLGSQPALAMRALIKDASVRLTSKYQNSDNIDATDKAADWLMNWWRHPDEVMEALNDEVYRNHEGMALYLADITEQMIRLFYEVLIPGWQDNFSTQEAAPHEDSEVEEFEEALNEPNPPASLVGQLDEHLQPGNNSPEEE